VTHKDKHNNLLRQGTYYVRIKMYSTDSRSQMLKEGIKFYNIKNLFSMIHYVFMSMQTLKTSKLECSSQDLLLNIGLD